MTRLLAPLAALALATGCNSKITTIDVDGSARTEVPGSSLLGSLVGELGFDGFTSMDITEASELQNQGVEPGDIRDAQMVMFELEAISPSGADLSFINSMSILVQSPDLPQEVIATQDSFPDGEGLVEFELTGVDLTDYVVSESMTITTQVNGTQPADDTVVEARYLLEVGVTLKGATRKRE